MMKNYQKQPPFLTLNVRPVTFEYIYLTCSVCWYSWSVQGVPGYVQAVFRKHFLTWSYHRPEDDVNLVACLRGLMVCCSCKVLLPSMCFCFALPWIVQLKSASVLCCRIVLMACAHMAWWRINLTKGLCIRTTVEDKAGVPASKGCLVA